MVYRLKRLKANNNIYHLMLSRRNRQLLKPKLDIFSMEVILKLAIQHTLNLNNFYKSMIAPKNKLLIYSILNKKDTVLRLAILNLQKNTIQEKTVQFQKNLNLSHLRVNNQQQREFSTEQLKRVHLNQDQ